MKKIEITRSWRTGRTLYHTGIYRIPADISEEVAERAIKENAGLVLPDEPPRRPGRRYGKTPAPENKVLSSPEDKEQPPFPPEED